MCDKATLDSILHQLSARAKEIFGDKLVKIILYGSYARGDYVEWSDIDIMVLVDSNGTVMKRQEHALWKYSNELSLKYDVVLSVVVNNYGHFENWKATLPFYSNVQSEGVVINA